MAIEDWYGLFELPDHDQIAPDELRQAPDRRAVVSAALDDLIEAGLVEVGVRPSMGEAPVTVSTEEAMQLIRDDGQWDTPPPDRIVVVGATPLGERLYRSEGTDTPPS